MSTPADNLSLNAYPKMPAGLDVFGCCSSYRACSDAKRCVIPEREYSRQCIYRRNLENGRIFYGKNSVFFSASLYEDFLSKYQALSPSEQQEFCEVVGLFVYWRLGTKKELLFVTPAILRMAELGLFELNRDPRQIMPLFTLRHIKECFNGCKIPSTLSRDELIDFVCSEYPSASQSATDGVAYASISFDLRTCYVEFYHDFMECSEQPPKIRLPLHEDNPNILKNFLRPPLGSLE